MAIEQRHARSFPLFAPRTVEKGSSSQPSSAADWGIMNSSCRSRSAAARIALALTAAQAMPWLIFLVAGASLLAVANESIAYRYFHSWRLVLGENGTIWEAQGQSLGLLHVLFQKILNGSEIQSLDLRIDLFSYATLFANSAALAVVVYWLARHRAIRTAQLAIVAAVTLFGVYGSGWGLSAARLPDYYTWEVTLTVAGLALFFIQNARSEPDTRLQVVMLLGGLAGVMIGIKITLAPAAALPVLPLLLSNRVSLKTRLATLAIWSGSAVASLGLILVAYYQFDPTHLRRAFEAWRSFVAAPGAEPGFIESLLNPFRPNHNPWVDHRFVWVATALWLVGAVSYASSLLHRRIPIHFSKLGLGAFLVVTSALHVLAVVRRPAETTLWESALFLLVAGGLFLSESHASTRKNGRVWVWSLLVVGWCVLSTARHFPRPTTVIAVRDAGRAVWEIHDQLSATNLPIVIVLPDNNYTSGSVEEALLKGFSDVPTWNISSGQALLDQLAPRRTFVSSFEIPPIPGVVMWTDLPGQPRAAESNPTLAQLLKVNPDGLSAWTIKRGPLWTRTVYTLVCTTGVPADRLPLVWSSGNWTTATDERPLDSLSISPREALINITVLAEDQDRFVRIEARQSTAYLALTGQLNTDAGASGHWRLRAKVRLNRPQPVITQIYDVIDADGTAETSLASNHSPAGIWTEHTVERRSTVFPHPGDNFSVGLQNVRAGDTIDVRLLELHGAQITPP